MRSVVSIPKQAAEEAQENPKVAEMKESLINAYPRLFSGVTNKNPPDRGRFGTARIRLKPNPKIYRHREYQLQGDRAEAMKKLLAEFIERGWIKPSDSEWASQAFIVPKKEKGEWRLVVDYRGLNEQTEHDSYSLPLINSILKKQQKKRVSAASPICSDFQTFCPDWLHFGHFLCFGGIAASQLSHRIFPIYF